MRTIMPLMVILGLAILQSAATAQNPSAQAPIPQPSTDIRMLNAPIPAASPHVMQNSPENPEAIPNGNLARITLADLEQIAMANNPTLAQAAMRVRALQGKQIQAGLYPNPVIGYIGDEMGNEGTAGQQGGFLRQELVTNGKRGLSQAVAGHEANQAEFALKSQRLRVINDVRTSGYEVIAAQRLIVLDEQLVRIGEECMKTAEHLLSAKEVGRVDILQSRVETNSTKLQLDNARNRHLAAWRKLAMVVGMPNLEPRPMADELEAMPVELVWNDTLTKLLTDSPELAQARAGVERARCSLAREQAERIPNVDLEGGLRYNNASRDSVAMVQVGVPLQIFNRNQGNIVKAQSELGVASNEVRRVELELQARLAEAFERYSSASQQVGRYMNEILPDAKKSLDLVRSGYEQGEFNYLELLTAQRTYFRVNLAYLESLREFWISRTRIEGMLLTGGLQSNSQ